MLPRPTANHTTHQLSMMLKAHFPERYTPAYHLHLAETLLKEEEDVDKKAWLAQWVKAYRISEYEEDRW